MVLGFCGTKLSVWFANAVAIGEQPVACAPDMRVVGSAIRPTLCSSWKPFQILVNSEPEAIGATTRAGERQPSCSATS